MTSHHIASRIAAVALAAAAVAAPTLASAQTAEGPWLVRARAVYLDPANKGDIDGLGINSKWIPEVDVTYFFTPNIAAELVLTYPQKQDVSLDGTKIGTLKHLPPTLSLQYHFQPTGTIRPYVGAGVNYTRFSSVHILGGAGEIDKSSFGLAFGGGVDIKVAERVYLNVDLKKVYIDTDVSAGGTKLGTFKVDPLLIGVGIGYRF